MIITLGTGASGNSADFSIPYNKNLLDYLLIGVYGTFSSATVKLQWKDPSGNYNDTVDSITASELYPLIMNYEVVYRFSWSGGGGSTSLNAKLFGVK